MKSTKNVLSALLVILCILLAPVTPYARAHRTEHDALGRPISEKDQAGKVTQFVYDSLGRLTKVKDALNQETAYGYNELGQQTLQKDALNRETKFEYDKLGRRTKRILPLGQIETYSYANDGNLQSKTDFNGKTTTFGYDSMRRLLSKAPDASLSQPTVSFTYNDLGQRATMTDASGVTNYSYDIRNRLASKQTPQGTLSYTYDEASNIKTLRSSNTNGVSIDYDYDQLNRLSSAKDNRLVGNQTTNYTYDATGNLQSYTYPNQVTTSYGYNSLNRLTAMTVANGQTNLASYNYTLGAAGNRTQVVELGGRTVNYVYDDLYRLTSETIANSANNGSISYQYDAVGNRLNRNSSVSQVPNQSSTFDANDRIGSDTFDANGNTKVSNGKTYNYDFENKLTSTSDGITIVYDGDGNRVSKTGGGVTTKYLVDTNNLTGYAQVVEELQGGNIVKTYTYGNDLILQRQGLAVNYYDYDGHGSVRALRDSNGNLTDTYDYDAFGNLLNRTGSTDNDYLYAGEQFDAGLGFYYNRARYLNTDSGRFISQDTYAGSSWEPSTLHRYLYARSEPVNSVDPSGNFDISIAGLTVSFTMRSVLTGISFGALFTGVDKALEGGSASEVAQAAAVGGVLGGVLSPFLGTLMGIRYLRAGLAGTGLGFSVVGAVKATTENNYTLAAFRALLFVGGSVAVLRAGVPGLTGNSGGGDAPLAAMLEAASQASVQVGTGSGHAHGSRAHTAFANIIRSWGDSGFKTEVTYFNGVEKRYGYPGGIRVDAVFGDVNSPRVVYDLKTGGASLTQARIQEIQQHLPGGNSVPVIEIKPGQ